MNAYIVRVTNLLDFSRRTFITFATARSTALYNVRAQNAFWDSNTYALRIDNDVLSVKLDGVWEVKES